MQKFLQNELVREAESTFSKGQSGESGAPTQGQETAAAPAPRDAPCSLAEFTFTLPARFKFVDPATLPKLPSNTEMKTWRTDANPGGAFIATATKDPSNANIKPDAIPKTLNNYFAGLADGLGAKVSNRTNLQTTNVNGVDYTHFEL